jgi:hypothetical protein
MERTKTSEGRYTKERKASVDTNVMSPSGWIEKNVEGFVTQWPKIM